MTEIKKKEFFGVELYTRKRSFKDYLSILNMLPDPDPVLRERGEDISVYRKLRNDSHLLSCMIKREAGLFSCDWNIIPAYNTRKDRKIADFVKEVFINMKIENTRYDILNSYYYGFSVLEKNYTTDGNYVVYESVVGKPQEWFFFDGENRLCFKSKDNFSGEPVDMQKVILVQECPEYNNPYGRRIASAVFWPIIFKRGGIQFWVEFVEKYGGVLMYLLTQEKDEGRKRQKLAMLDDMVRTAVGVYETGDELKIVDVNKSGSSDTFITMLNFFNAEISKAVLGQTLTTEQGERGARSLGEVHLEVQREIIEQDKKRELKVINKLVKELVSLNFDTTDFPRYVLEEKEELKFEKAKRDTELVGQGIKFNKSYYIKQYGFDEEDFDLQENAINSQIFNEVKKNFSELNFTNEYKEIFKEDEAFEKLYSDTLTSFKDVFEEFFNALKNAIENSNDYDEATENILKTLFINEDYRTKVNKIAENFVKANLIGREAAIRQRITEKTKNFADEVEYLKNKVVLKKEIFNTLPDEMKNYAFTVAGIEREKQIEEILQSLVEAKEKRLSFEEWKQKTLEKGFKVNDIVYWQNMRSVEMAGKYQQMREDADDRVAPYWQYIAVMDKNTRPEHAALNGLIRRYDDPFWKEWYPPNGYNCRCTVRSLSRAYLEANGINPDKINRGMPDFGEIAKNNRGNEAFESFISQRLNSFDKDGKLYFEPDAGFGNNVGENLYEWISIKNNMDTTDNWQLLGGKKVNLTNELENFKSVDRKVFTGTREKAIEIIKNQFDKKAIIDRFGIPVYMSEKDIIKFLNHIEKDKNRFKYIGMIKEIVESPDILICNIQAATGKMMKKGLIKLGRIYVKKINNKTVAFITNYTTQFPRYTGWTLYETEELKGTLIFKKE